MADLKAGSTVGGLPIWHQGTMPLVPAGNSLTYKGYKVYTANDKPQAADNDFVSKAGGGQYLSVVSFKRVFRLILNSLAAQIRTVYILVMVMAQNIQNVTLI